MYYETIFIVSPDVSQENTQELIDALTVRVEKASGRIVKREYWGVRSLAYQIAKRKRGHYVLLVTDGTPEAAMVLEQALRLEERVLRFLTTRLQELSDNPSPLLPRKAAEPVEESVQDSDDNMPQAETLATVNESIAGNNAPETTSTGNNPVAASEPEKTVADGDTTA